MHDQFLSLIIFLLGAVAASSAAAAVDGGNVWYIAAQEALWDYLPGEQNKCMRTQPAGNEEFQEHWLWTKAGLGSTLKKAVYVQYADDSFQVRQRS